MVLGIKAGAYSGLFAGMFMGIIMTILNHAKLVLFPPIVLKFISETSLKLLVPIGSVAVGVVIGAAIGFLFSIFHDSFPGNSVHNAIMFCVLIWSLFLLILPVQIFMLFPNKTFKEFYMEFYMELSTFIIVNLFVYILAGWLLGRYWERFFYSKDNAS